MHRAQNSIVNGSVLKPADSPALQKLFRLNRRPLHGKAPDELLGLEEELLKAEDELELLDGVYWLELLDEGVV